eukprot:TRINITY_DN4326_c0_g1_i2.p1 TRINITY_DN4326_c0_g1~~TRINITY_DN4326_c0_g1_i2.p1  ORF type:complete len:342 (-),score=24.56 TRINITY_DN4326_c0_g1_i2:3-1028(-)
MSLDIGVATAYAAITGMALFPIWFGSKRSLTSEFTETMSTEDAWMFPIVGSGVLFGLYVLFTVLELKEYVNILLTLYFLVFGIFAMSSSLKPFLQSILRLPQDPNETSYKIPLPLRSEPLSFTFTLVDFISLIISIIIGVWYYTTKHWIANNLLGLAFSIQGVALISLGSFKVATILLSGLFFYDIFWVFGTDVMVTVAKSFDAPVKLIFPKNIYSVILNALQLQEEAPEVGYSMLGLGDIVIPGIFIALMLRFDKSQNRTDEPFVFRFHIFMLCVRYGHNVICDAYFPSSPTSFVIFGTVLFVRVHPRILFNRRNLRVIVLRRRARQTKTCHKQAKTTKF